MLAFRRVLTLAIAVCLFHISALFAATTQERLATNPDSSKNIAIKEIFKNCNVAYFDDCALGYAIKAKNYDAIDLLIKSGVNPNGKRDHTPTPLRLASSMGDLQIVKLLVDSGADTLSGDPISIAKENGHAEVAKYLSDNQNTKLYSWYVQFNQLVQETFPKISKKEFADKIDGIGGTDFKIFNIKVYTIFGSVFLLALILFLYKYKNSYGGFSLEPTPDTSLSLLSSSSFRQYSRKFEQGEDAIVDSSILKFILWTFTLIFAGCVTYWILQAPNVLIELFRMPIAGALFIIGGFLGFLLILGLLGVQFKGIQIGTAGLVNMTPAVGKAASSVNEPMSAVFAVLCVLAFFEALLVPVANFLFEILRPISTSFAIGVVMVVLLFLIPTIKDMAKKLENLSLVIILLLNTAAILVGNMLGFESFEMLFSVLRAVLNITV